MKKYFYKIFFVAIALIELVALGYKLYPLQSGLSLSQEVKNEEVRKNIMGSGKIPLSKPGHNIGGL